MGCIRTARLHRFAEADEARLKDEARTTKTAATVMEAAREKANRTLG
jgi:hypothetical protein